MRKNSLCTLLMAGVVLTSLVVFSCKKEDKLSAQEEEQVSVASSESEAESEAVFNDVFDNVIGVNSEVGLSGTGVFGGRTSGATQVLRDSCYITTITRLTTGQFFPIRIEIDFGAGCTGKDGHVRSGKIVTEYTGRLMIPGKSATTTFVNYKYDSISVEGTHKITNTGTIAVRQFTVDITGAKLTKPNGNYSKRESHRVTTQVEGMLTPEIHMDDTFTITGQASGEVKSGNLLAAWESAVIEPLRKRFACRWISKGIVKIVRKNLATDSKWAGTLDYGSGECDNKAILNINGKERQISLR